MTDVASFLDENTGEQHPAFKFTNIGDTCTGVIAATPRVRELVNKFTNAVEPTLIMTVTKDDGETCTVYAKGRAMLSAIGGAVRTATGSSDLQAGARIAIRYTEDLEVGKGNPAKLYVAQYQAPVTQASVSVDDLLGGQ